MGQDMKLSTINIVTVVVAAFMRPKNAENALFHAIPREPRVQNATEKVYGLILAHWPTPEPSLATPADAYLPAEDPPLDGYQNARLDGWDHIHHYDYALAKKIIAYLRDRSAQHTSPSARRHSVSPAQGPLGPHGRSKREHPAA